MRVKRFTGQTMNEAVSQLRAEFGRDAVILHTRQKRRGPFGLFGKPIYEIIGAVDPEASEKKASVKQVEVKKAEEHKVQQKPPAAVKKELAVPDQINKVYQDILTTGLPREAADSLFAEALRIIPESEWGNTQQIWEELASQIARSEERRV